MATPKQRGDTEGASTSGRQAAAASDGTCSATAAVQPMPGFGRQPPPGAPGPPPAAGDDGDGTGDMEELIDSYGYTWLHGFLFAFLALAGLAPAKEMVTLSLLGPALACHFGLPLGAEGALQAAAFGGALLAGPFYGYLADAAGRKPTIALACLAIALPSAATALAPSFPAAVALRFLVGLGLPFDPVMFTYYLEFLPDGSRGSQVVALTLAWAAGLALEAGVAWAAFTLTPDWRAFALASAAPSILAALLAPLLPESPFFLADRGRSAAAHSVVSRLAAAAGAEPPPPPPPDEAASDSSRPSGPGCCASAVGLPLRGVGEVLAALCSRCGRAWKTIGLTIFTAGLAAATIGLVELSVLLHAVPPLGSSTTGGAQGAVGLDAAVVAGMPSPLYGFVGRTDAGSAALCDPAGGLSLGPRGWEQLLLANLSAMWGVLLACGVIDCLGRRASLGVMLAVSALAASAMLIPGLSLPAANAFLVLARTAAHGGYPILAVYVGDLYAGHLRGFGESLAETSTSLSYMLAPLAVDLLTSQLGLAAAVIAVAGALWLGLVALLLTPGQPSAEEIEEEGAADTAAAGDTTAN